MQNLCLSCFAVLMLCFTNAEQLDDAFHDLYIVEGKVFPPDNDVNRNWQIETRILVNGGEFLGFLKEDGTFTISNVPSGSYVLEVANPNYYYEPVRVEINPKGKFRARKVNYIQPSQVLTVPYPLKLKSYSKLRYFQAREQWRMTDILLNPMVLMMVLPMAIIMILPKMMNDPETKKEMEQLNNMTKYDMPEMSELITTFFTGDKQKSSHSHAVKSSKKKQ